MYESSPSHYPDGTPEFTDVPFIDEDDAMGDQYPDTDPMYSPGITSDVMSEAVHEAPAFNGEPDVFDTPEQADKPGIDTENPFRKESDILPDGWQYISHEQMVIKWHDEREANVAKARTFGSLTLSYYDATYGLAKTMGIEDYEPALAAKEQVRRELDELRDTLCSYVDDDNITKSLIEHLPDPQLVDEYTHNGTRHIAEGIADLDDDAFMDYLRQRANSVTKKCEALETGKFEPVIARFKERVAGAITEQNLPLDLQTAMTRLDNIKVIYADPLRGIGRFSPETGVSTIGLDESYDDVALESKVWHELEHTLEGWEPAVNDQYGGILNQRSGLKHHAINAPKYGRWLDEVVADKMSILLKNETIDFADMQIKELMSKDNRAPHYADEEAIFGTILNGPNGRVSFYDVLAAYYENYDPHAPDGERLPNLKNLHAQLATAWGGFENVAPAIHDADRHNWTGPDRDPRELPYTKILGGLIDRYIEVARNKDQAGNA